MKRPSQAALKELFTLIELPLFRKILDALSIGIAILDREGFYLYANQAYAELHGFKDPERYLGKHTETFFSTADIGSMTALSTCKKNQVLSISVEGKKGICTRTPILDNDAGPVCLVTETLTTNISKANMKKLMSMLSSLIMNVDYKNEAHASRCALHTFASIISVSPVMERLKKTAKRYALTDKPILICGESGTGKELLAQAIHMASPRATEPFIAVNCAALPENLVESELFGYAEGAFTGSRRNGQKGKFELAHKGTIFLDEIGELPLPMQGILLRVLESGEIQKLGSPTVEYADFRLIAATNRNLLDMKCQGDFREDLYHRISMLQLDIPPLRQRREDIAALVATLTEEIVGHARSQEIKITKNCLKILMESEWRGNIREMRNVLTAAMCNLDADEKVLRVSHLPPRFLNSVHALAESRRRCRGTKNSPLDEVRSMAEREAIIATLEQCKENRTRAAAKLGISRTKLYSRLKQFGIL